MKPKIGFIGLGAMGLAMARNLLNAGHDLAVFNRTPDKAGPLKELGAQEADDPAEMADWADMVILILSGEAAVEAVLEGSRGLLAGTMDGKVLVNMGTVSPAYSRELSRRLARRTITLLDAPVSGCAETARDGTLIILASGPPVVIKQLTPVLLAMGKKVVNCGPAGSGSAMKEDSPCVAQTLEETNE